MKEVPDNTGRFGMRPHYEPAELDRACEAILAEFFRVRGRIPTPIPTDDLTSLIERDVSDFDPGSDLSEYGSDVEGVTEFVRDGKPRVRIAGELAFDERRENRYRTTLTHEYGHVHFHAYLFDLAHPAGRSGSSKIQVCKRETLLGAPRVDWMEWQAGYVCGALLMPASRVRRLVAAFQAQNGLDPTTTLSDADAMALAEVLREEFRVSKAAAQMRLVRMSLSTQL